MSEVRGTSSPTPAKPSTGFPEGLLNTIVQGDVLQCFPRIPDNSVDLIVTSPPYNLRNSSGNGLRDGRGGKWERAALLDGYSHHDDCMPLQEYNTWQRQVLQECMRVLKEDGALFYNHKWRVQNGLLQDREEIVRGFPVRQIIIWKRQGGLNFNPGYFLPTYEVIYLIAKPNFNLAPKANAYGDVWEIAQDFKNEHPAAFPATLVERIINSTRASIVLDPFMGSGTTALVARLLKRQFIGFEISPDYCKMAEDRLAKHKQGDSLGTSAGLGAQLGLL